MENILQDGAIWTYSNTITLLKLYENKLHMLETPKKKTRIWLAISESLRDYNIKMTADQVRWKINALSKKYKHCLDTGKSLKFKHFNEMDIIYTKFNVDCDTFALGELMERGKDSKYNTNPPMQINSESKAIIELRKVRLANRIESDRTQGKLNMEKQWLEYLKRAEQNRLLQDDTFDRNLEIRKEVLELYRQDLEIQESIELRKLELKEREQNELMRLEREKCDMLKKVLNNKYF